MSTLTLCISVSVHTLTSVIFLHKLCFMIILEHSEFFSLENYVHIIILISNVRNQHRASHMSVM